MTHKTFLFAALVGVLGWCCVSCESNEPSTTGGSSTYVSKGFSVSANKQVIFSPGNLQYQASTDTWRFANHQYDYVGELNEEISPTNENWIDLFGWGTGNNPTNTSEYEPDYATFVDWGTNKIGKYKANTWRTLTMEEWKYLFLERPRAQVLWGVATINGVHGLILLPNDWKTLDNITFVSGTSKDWSINAFSIYEWEKMEKTGAVFLPVSSTRYGSKVDESQIGLYWSSSYCTNSQMPRASAYDFYFYSTIVNPQHVAMISLGLAVRLVKDL